MIQFVWWCRGRLHLAVLCVGARRWPAGRPHPGSGSGRCPAVVKVHKSSTSWWHHDYPVKLCRSSETWNTSDLYCIKTRWFKLRIKFTMFFFRFLQHSICSQQIFSSRFSLFGDPGIVSIGFFCQGLDLRPRAKRIEDRSCAVLLT